MITFDEITESILKQIIRASNAEKQVEALQQENQQLKDLIKHLEIKESK